MKFPFSGEQVRIWWWNQMFPGLILFVTGLLVASCAIWFAAGPAVDWATDRAIDKGLDRIQPFRPWVEPTESDQAPGPPTPAPNLAFGWVPDRKLSDAYAAQLEFQDFSQTPAYRLTRSADRNVFLWDACRQVTGDLLPPRDQGQVGSCVSFGYACGVEHLLCVQIANGESPGTEYRDVCQEVIYAGSRVEVGGGQINGDGSTGAWASEWCTKYGIVPRGPDVGGYDLSRYDQQRCREWGRRGVPDDLEPLAKQHPVKTVTRVTSWAQGKAAIANGYPVVICSNQGFSRQRDSQGFARAEGQWAHCMCLVGIRSDREGGFIINSWGERFHTGPLGLGDPSPAGFWAEARVIDRMLSEGDSFALSAFDGFPRREIDWYAEARPRPRVFADTFRSPNHQLAP